MITIQNYEKIRGMGLVETRQHRPEWLPPNEWDGHPTLWIDTIEDLQTHYSIQIRHRQSDEEFQLRIHRTKPEIDLNWNGSRLTGWVEPDYDMAAVLNYAEMGWAFVRAQPNLPPF